MENIVVNGISCDDKIHLINPVGALSLVGRNGNFFCCQRSGGE
jgi:hypothetical protein